MSSISSFQNKLLNQSNILLIIANIVYGFIVNYFLIKRSHNNTTPNTFSQIFENMETSKSLDKLIEQPNFYWYGRDGTTDHTVKKIG